MSQFGTIPQGASSQDAFQGPVHIWTYMQQVTPGLSGFSREVVTGWTEPGSRRDSRPAVASLLLFSVAPARLCQSQGQHHYVGQGSVWTVQVGQTRG